MNALDLSKNDGVKLKGCPFCGSARAAVIGPNCRKTDPVEYGDRAFPVVRCFECFAEVPGNNWDHKGVSAAEAWNRRHDETPSEYDRLCGKDRNHV